MTSTGKGLEIRFEAGEILGALGDPRIENYPMVHVEAGEFTMGSDELEREQPIHRVYLDEFMIGKYPVTNEEFKSFIENNGYQNEEFWPHEGWQWRERENISEPRYWHDRKWNGLNFPVVGVSWYEAASYANWLSKVTGKPYRLPTEAEWEKAARGTDGRKYPWGNEFDKNSCNSGESELNRTSPVGIFPKGKSPYGCFDMIGNVWEWCADWYDVKYYPKSPGMNPQGPSSGSLRMSRGGSWFDVAQFCSCAVRHSVLPAVHSDNLGFRLARSF
jgi:formylglycine-generating enzyme required for sulfatase activity